MRRLSQSIINLFNTSSENTSTMDSRHMKSRDVPISGLTTSNPATRSEPTPIHELEGLVANPQNECPFFNGRIPPEIRDAIFQYALSEDTKADPASAYPIDTHYTRPGYTGHRIVATSLLRTCRRVYLETYHLPVVSKEHVFWHERGPDDLDFSSQYDCEYDYFPDLKPWQLALVKDIHIFTQLYWLEQFFTCMCNQPFMHGLEKVHITIRRSDWWWYEQNSPLAITPQRCTSNPPPAGSSDRMLQDWSAEKNGRVVPWAQGAWGSAFAKLTSLKELVIEFETSYDKVDELNAIVEKAKTWRFPLKNGLALSAEGLLVTASTWYEELPPFYFIESDPGDTYSEQGPMCYWSDLCPHCQGHGKCTGSAQQCEERMHSRAEKKGPMCHVKSVRWKVVSAAKGYEKQ